MTLTKIQAQERAKRKRNRLLQMYGQSMPKGTRLREYQPVTEPTYRLRPGVKVHIPMSFSDFMLNVSLIFSPWWRRKVKQDRELMNQLLEPPKK